jgi:hypothetical protein
VIVRENYRFFVVSGFRKENIWYNRCNFAGRYINCVLINYPAAEKHEWDNVVTRISNTLAADLTRARGAPPRVEPLNPPASIPEFLRKWPYLQTQQDVDRYATVSKSTQLVRKDSMRRTTDSAARRTASRDFHTSLKAQLGQR